MNRRRPARSTAATAKFGTFKGVFTPSVLTILGVIMYLRFGWVVGNAGLLGAIAVVLLAHVISFTTGMSIVSIATNREVKAGGDYYMISRALGMPIGGAIGLALFAALALSTSLYLIGFSESFLDAFGFENTLFARRIVGSVGAVALTALTFFSTSLALRVQYFVLAAILLSLVSLFAGRPDFEAPREVGLWFADGAQSFEVVFAVFFPAVTGFTAGVAMSGDLADPRKSLPRGTMAAIVVGLLIYLAIPIFLALKVDPAMLREDKMIWMKVALVPPLVIAGVFAATLSSALGSVLGAPRYLQALARDGVVPRILGRGHGALDEPRVATVVTFVIAEGGILIGELDLIARVITMFFLTSYGFLCLASAVQTWSGISSFRPDFRTPAWVSFTGAATCLAVMFKLDTMAMAGATVVMAIVYLVLRRKRFKVSGDTWQGFWSAVVRTGIRRLHGRPVDSMSWQFNAAVFGRPPAERGHLIRLARWIVAERGLATYFQLFEGDLRRLRAGADEAEPETRAAVTRLYPGMLTKTVVARDFLDGVLQTAQSYGLAGMTPNTLIMDWPEARERHGDFARMVSDLAALDQNLLFLRCDEERGFGDRRSIDIWWRGLEKNGALMLLLADLFDESADWKGATIRVNVLVDAKKADAEKIVEETNIKLLEILGKSRVNAVPNVIARDPEDRPIGEIIQEVSGGADLVLLGLRAPDEGEDEAFVERTEMMASKLRAVLFVRASVGFDGSAVLFDE